MIEMAVISSIPVVVPIYDIITVSKSIDMEFEEEVEI